MEYKSNTNHSSQLEQKIDHYFVEEDPKVDDDASLIKLLLSQKSQSTYLAS